MELNENEGSDTSCYGEDRNLVMIVDLFYCPPSPKVIMMPGDTRVQWDARGAFMQDVPSQTNILI